MPDKRSNNAIAIIIEKHWFKFIFNKEEMFYTSVHDFDVERLLVSYGLPTAHSVWP